MSLVFGGKLLAPKPKRSANDQNSLDASRSVQLLSKREQELLEELQKTRTDIVKELVRVSPQIRNDEIDSWKNSIEKYQSNLSASKKIERPLTSLEAKKHFRRRSEIQASKTLQSLTVMSSTGEFAFGFQTKRDDSFVLPVLKLPEVRTAWPQSVHPLEIISKTPSLPSDSTLPFNFDQFDVNFMMNYFSISQSLWDEIVHNFDKLCRYVHPSFEDHQGDEFPPTVFMSVSDRFSDLLCHNSTFSDRSRNNQLRISLPPINPMASQNQSNTMVVSSKKLNTKSLKNPETGKILSKTRKRLQSQRSMQIEPSRNSLREELITSLESMQRYTSEVCPTFRI